MEHNRQLPETGPTSRHTYTPCRHLQAAHSLLARTSVPNAHAIASSIWICRHLIFASGSPLRWNRSHGDERYRYHVLAGPPQQFGRYILLPVHTSRDEETAVESIHIAGRQQHVA